MKKWLTLVVLGAAVVATAGMTSPGMSSRVAGQPAPELTDAEIDARMDARLHEVMRTVVLAGQRSEASTVALGR